MPLYDYDQNVIGAFAYAMDISKLKFVENELVANNNAKNKLLSIISHDFRTPLNSLKGVLKLAQHIEPSEMGNFIEKLSSQVNVVSSTLDNLLGWVKTQFEGFHVKPKDIDLADIIEKSIALYQLPITNKSIEIVNNLGNDSIVKADPDHLLLVFRNLISNSVKFTPHGGHIQFDFKKSNGHSHVIVKDDGIGMDDVRLSEITNGQKVINSELGTNGEKGTGLGLSFCKDLLALNQIEMKMSSKVNKGTKVEMTFEN